MTVEDPKIAIALAKNRIIKIGQQTMPHGVDSLQAIGTRIKKVLKSQELKDFVDEAFLLDYKPEENK